ncbi:MAG: hypothetical protein PHW25_06175 [Zoogloea sp.]|uniref:hypothetical protein n=1 Tax=Zoogloea sp. TaxID=49181 RepID=UPI002634942D|nr:hypothetical protein [Zoogloea sp.]MDD3326653.1 hypothetical protein [Zoogloea sp.]
MKKLKKIFVFLFSFGVARGGLFAAPILLANLLAPIDYARLEFVQAVSSMGATLLGLGSASIVPLVLLRNQENLSLKLVYFHQISCAAVLLVLLTFGLILDSKVEIWLAAMGVSILMLQGLWSVTLKSHGKRERALFLDLGFWGVLAVAATIAFICSVPLERRGGWVVVSIAMYWAALVVWTSKRYNSESSQVSPESYFLTLKTGAPLMIGTLLSFLATTSGRVGVGLLAAPEMVAAYAVLFRATALPMVAHQVMTVSRFRQLFQLPLPQLERKLSVIVLLVSLCALLFWQVGSHLGFLLGPVFVKTFAVYKQEGLLILAQSIMWSAIAQNELLNNRSQTARKLIFPAIIYFALAFSAVWLFFGFYSFSLMRFVCAHVAVVMGFFLVQIAVMWLNGIKVYKSWLCALGCYGGFSLLTQFFGFV